MKIKYTHKIISWLVLVVFLVCWQLISVFLNIEFFFGTPILIYYAIVKNADQLFYNALITGVEAFVGFIFGVFFGILVGFLLWYSPLVAKIFKPYIVVAGAVPVFAFAPIIIFWFGIGMGMKIVLAAFGAFIITLTQAYEGAQSINVEKYRLLDTFGASRFHIMNKVIFPASLSWVIVSMKLSVGLALLGAFIGEFISSKYGLGYFMLRAGSLYDIPAVFAGGFFLVILSMILNIIVLWVEKYKYSLIGILTVDRRIRKIPVKY